MARSERVFSISASPDLVWRTLLTEVQPGADADRARILHEEPPRYLRLDVPFGWSHGVIYDYRLRPVAAGCEVAVEVAPYGIRFAIGNIFSLGRGLTPYMLAVTQGLANLKEECEQRVAEGGGSVD